MPSRVLIQSRINGEEVDFLCEPRQSLLEVLRETLGLTGTKEGCNNGNCGACGFILAAKALLEREPDADEARIRHWLAGNLCRCTGYDKIVRAVMDAAGQMRKE